MTMREANQLLADDLKLVIRDAENLLRATADQTGEKLSDARDRLSARLVSARRTCEAWQARAMEAARATGQVLSEHPYEVAAALAGITLLLTALCLHRCRSCNQALPL